VGARELSGTPPLYWSACMVILNMEELMIWFEVVAFVNIDNSLLFYMGDLNDVSLLVCMYCDP
jgi:hypothetical protein